MRLDKKDEVSSVSLVDRMEEGADGAEPADQDEVPVAQRAAVFRR